MENEATILSEPSRFNKPDEAELDLPAGEISKIELPIREDLCQCGEALARAWRLWKNIQH